MMEFVAWVMITDAYRLRRRMTRMALFAVDGADKDDDELGSKL